MEYLLSNTTLYRPSRGDRWALIAFVAAGVGIVIGTAVFAAGQILRLVGPGPIAIPVTFGDFEAPLPYGEPGASLPVAVDSGTITVADPTAALITPGILGAVVTLLITATVVGCLVGLSISLLRGTIFSKRNSRLVAAAGITSLIGVALQKVFEVMQSNAAIHLATGGKYDAVAVTVAPGSFVIAAFAIAMICTVFVVGERMQRDQEGLV